LTDAHIQNNCARANPVKILGWGKECTVLCILKKWQKMYRGIEIWQKLYRGKTNGNKLNPVKMKIMWGLIMYRGQIKKYWCHIYTILIHDHT